MNTPSKHPINTQSSADLLARVSNEQGNMTRKMQTIADFLIENPTRFIKLSAKEICSALGTSDPTLIKFCQGFGYSGLADFRIDLAVGLASHAENAIYIEPSHSDRRDLNTTAKNEIAQHAFELMTDDRTIVLDNGSTVEQLAKRLRDHPGLTIMTSGLVVAQNAMTTTQHKVILTGGEIRQKSLSMSGRLVEMAIREMRFDTAYIGADSIDAEAGLSTFLEEEAHQTRAMVFASRRIVVLADQSKFNKPSLHWICGLDRIDTLVTDAPLNDPTVIEIIQKGVKVISTQDAKTK